MLQQDHAVRDALHLQVVIGRRHVVEQDDGATAAGEILLRARGSAAGSAAGCRRPAAAPTASRTRRGSASAAATSSRINLVVAASSTSDGWNIVYCSSASSDVLVRQQLADRDAGQIPAVRLGDGFELLACFRQRDVEDRLAAPARLRSGTASPAWSCPTRARPRPDTAGRGPVRRSGCRRDRRSRSARQRLRSDSTLTAPCRGMQVPQVKAVLHHMARRDDSPPRHTVLHLSAAYCNFCTTANRARRYATGMK